MFSLFRICLVCFTQCRVANKNHFVECEFYAYSVNHRQHVGLSSNRHNIYLFITQIIVEVHNALHIGRDVVLDASASARGGIEAVFQLARPRLGLTRSCLGLGSIWKVAPCLGLVISQLKRASAHGAQVQV